MRSARVALVLLVLFGACRSRLVDEGSPVDAATTTDQRGPGVDGGSCGHRELVEVALASLQRIDAQSFGGAAVRVELKFPWRPRCDVLGAVEVTELGLGCADCVGFSVVAHVWRSTAPGECGATSLATQVLVLTDAWPQASRSTVLQIRDGAMGGARALSLTNAPSPSTDCAPVELGRFCSADCQCSGTTPVARCLPIKLGALAVAGQCGIPCSEDVDCPESAPSCAASAAPAFTCVLNSSCRSDGDCPFAQICLKQAGGQACHRSPTVASQPAGCRCDSDCGEGAICAVRGTGSFCVFPCATVSDCPGPRGCGSFSACIESACVRNLC